MSRDRSGSDYSENTSDVTTCSCMASSVEKCSLRGCGGGGGGGVGLGGVGVGVGGMFQEPFFLHPPGSRPRDGIYINPMSAYINEPQKPKDMESFYLHSPHDLVYTRITHLFNDVEKPRNGVLVSTTEQRHVERKDETLTVKVDVHINNGGSFGKTHPGNGHTGRTEITRETPSEHAYEQICLRQEETSSVGSSGNKKIIDNASDSSRSRKTNRRYSRSSSASESSNMSSEIHCFSSTTSTPSLSRNSSNERINKSTKINADILHERKESSTNQVESEKEIRPSNNSGPSFTKPPPPPPPPPPDREDVVVLVVNSKQNGESNNEKKDGNDNGEENKTGNATNKSDVSCGEHQQPEVPPASPPADVEEIKTIQTSHLINRHMVLPFIPPKFANAADSDTLLKPSEYLKSICKNVSKNTLSKARSVDNLDCQGRDTEEEEEQQHQQHQQQQQQQEQKNEKEKESPPGPPPPPLSPLQKSRGIPNCNNTNATTPSPSNESENSKSPQQPLATISIQDLTSIQLRRTNTKMNATKTFSAPPPRSASMTNVSEPFFVQKTDLIAELKRTKDIPGIKKLKVERAQVEKTQEQNLISEISKAFSVSNFVDQIPEKDSSGNVIPIWKRQMLARKAAERAKKELEEQIARENEERRQKAIPPWKRQLLAKKDNEDKKINNNHVQSNATIVPAVKIEIAPKRDSSPATIGCNNRKEEKNDNNTDEKGNDTRDDDSDDGQIIPWRAQLRKTNSKLNILD
ncbi:PREDICTED: probable serine/threonine-protein kinase mps1 isoform X2 [Polistes dominula]|nr:PREDICTED: probable serine/threonine-protein kinase mps1 isoform X2 [Polistes dominula]